jgi:DNA-binding XRE family transcriptional regulator
MTSPALERLGQLVQTRRAELKLGVEPAAKLAGISKDTWKRLEAGLRVWDRSFAGVETALQWAGGSCRIVLDGGDPVINEPSEESPEAKIAQVPKTELERLVGDAIQSAAIKTKGSLTGDEILELNARVLQELRERGVI